MSDDPLAELARIAIANFGSGSNDTPQNSEPTKASNDDPIKRKKFNAIIAEMDANKSKQQKLKADIKKTERIKSKWEKLHAMPADWSHHQLKHYLNADDGLKEKKGGKILQHYPSDALPLGALTMGRKKPSNKAGLLCYTGDSHLLTVAPTRSGKGTTQIVPSLLTYEGSAVIIDIKGENHALTARHRANIINGAEVCKFAPFEDETAQFNPLDFIRPGEQTFGDSRFIAELMIPSSAHGEDFWIMEARNLLAVFLTYVKTSPAIDDTRRNIRYLIERVIQNPSGIDNTLDTLQAESEAYEVRQLAAVFSSYDEKVKSSVLAQLNAQIMPWKDEAIYRATGRSSFNFEQLKVAPALSIYICIPPEKLRSCRNVLRTLIGIAIHSMTRSKARPKKQVLFMLDEFPSLGFMPVILDGLAYLAGYGAKLWVFAQSLSQLRATYGDAWQLFPNSAGAFTAFNINDMETANYIEQMLGKTDDYQQTYISMEQRRITTQGYVGDGEDNFFFNLEQSDNSLKKQGYKVSEQQSNARGLTWEKWIEEPRKQKRWTQDNIGAANLIRQLGDKFAFVQLAGEKPALVRKIPYYSHQYFIGKYDEWE